MGANGENPNKILNNENEAYWTLAWSPASQRLAYVKSAGSGVSIETVPLDGGPPSVVLSDPKLWRGLSPLIWMPDGRIIFNSIDASASYFGNLWEIMTDPQTGQPSGKPTRITNWDGVQPNLLSVSRDGRRLVVVKSHARNDVYVGELKDGGTLLASPTRLTVSESADYPSGWMPDSKTILFQSNRTGRYQIFRQQLEQDTAEPVIQGPDDETDAELSPDGRWILYWSWAHGGGDPPPTTKRLMRYPASGGSPEPVLEAPSDAATDFHCPSRPASSCVLSRWEQGELIFYALDPAQGRGKDLARTELGMPAVLDWSISPDGSRVAIASRDQLREQVRILDLRKNTERNLQLPQGWFIFRLNWAANDNTLFAAALHTTRFLIARIDLDGKTHVLLDRGRNQFPNAPCASPDGRHLAFGQQTWEDNAWLLENF